ncbi:AMP-binding protein, partial [Pseudomonas aeruginosa]
HVDGHYVAAGHALLGQDVLRGDAVSIYMPMIPQGVAAMLACSRIGALHWVSFGSFSPEARAGQINDSKSKALITADEVVHAYKALL